ncbi:MAG: carboxylesterase family protein [Alphaproteobacteria bacterium]|nr:carboxylesterase family protein [Alphaproteobacteria bacterium]
MRSTRTLTAALFCAAVAGAFSLSACAAPELGLQVETGEGPVLGMQSQNGALFWGAVPYAAAPVGDARWRPPQPAPVREAVLEAFVPGAPCAQPAYGDAESGLVLGSEDCLTLNIHAPSDADGAPVMVWIHGGGNYAGAAREYDGAVLAEREGVVVVTINYRLGPFGWFHHPAIRGERPDAPTGQFAVLDMIAALQWVQANIEGFGGDAGRVTIFGESAGGQNIYALVLAEPAQGLFHRAISQSGGLWNMTLAQAVNPSDAETPGTRASASEILAAWIVAAGRADNRDAALELLSSMSDDAVAAFMRDLSTEAVLAPYRDQPDLGYDLPSVVLDGVIVSQEGHRTQLASGAYNQVPMMLGGNLNEQKAWMAYDPAYVEFTPAGPVARDRDQYAAIDEHYSNWWNASAVDDIADHAVSPVYAYRFDWADAPTEPVDLAFLVGAAHGIEIPFLFGDFSGGFESLFTPDNRAGREALSRAMSAYWAEFARSGDPGDGGAGLPQWETWGEGRQKMIFDAGDIAMAPAPLTFETLVDRLIADERLSEDERCMILRHNTMYPEFALERLAQAGCAP